jgi:hypothetical protein
MTLASVEFKIGGKDSGVSLDKAPFKVTVDASLLKNGNVGLQAVAKDTAGNMATSATVTVTVKNEVPTVVITGPASPATGTYFMLSADVTAGAGMTIDTVQFLVDEGPVGEKLKAAPYQVLEVQLDPGEHVITVVAVDKAGNTTKENATIDVSQT